MDREERLRMRFTKLFCLVLASALLAVGCSRPPATANTAPTPAPARTPGPLPDAAFKAQLTLPDAPTKLRAGQKETVQVHIKNASDVFWWSRGGEINDRT